MVIFYKKFKKYNETQLTKNKMNLNIRKMTTRPRDELITTKYKYNDNKHNMVMLYYYYLNF